MISGYAYELDDADVEADWLYCSDELWDTVIYEPVGSEERLGRRRIDGSPCVVFRCPDGRIRAQTAVAVGEAD